MTRYVITANRTEDGAVAFLTPAGAWSAHLAEALLVEREVERDALLAQARGQQAIVCDPYIIKVQVDDGHPQPVGTRERIRAAGPAATLAALGYLEAAPSVPVGGFAPSAMAQGV